jgi:hypothetical protein
MMCQRWKLTAVKVKNQGETCNGINGCSAEKAGLLLYSETAHVEEFFLLGYDDV